MSEGVKINEASRDDEITGTELIPAADGSSPKCVSIGDVKDFVLAKIASLSAASGVNVSTDGVYVLKDGALKPVSAQTLAQSVMDYAFGLVGVVSPNGNEILSVKDGSTRKTITTGGILRYIQSNISTDFVIHALASADPLNGSQLAVVSQNGSEKKVSLTTLANFALSTLHGYATELTGSASGNDWLYVYRDGATRKIKVSQLGIGGGDVTGPSTTTEDNIPQWDSSTKVLKNGLGVASSISDSPSASKVPTEAAVAAGLGSKAVAPTVSNWSTDAAGRIPLWSGTAKALSSGKSVVTSVRSIDGQSPATDDAVPTEKAVRSAINESVAEGLVKTTDAQTVGGVKTFSSSPIVPTPTADGEAANKSYVDSHVPTDVVKTTDAQTIGGVKTFTSSPIVPAPTSEMSAATKQYVDNKVPSGVMLLSTDQTVTGNKTFSGAVTVLAPTSNFHPATKKYVDDLNDECVKKSGEQTITGSKTFSTSPLVPTVADIGDSTQKAASTAFVHALVSQGNRPMFPAASKTFTSGRLALSDLTYNISSIDTSASTATLVMPSVTMTGYVRVFYLFLTVTGSGAFTLNLEGGTFLGENANTFNILRGGAMNVIGFTETGAGTGVFTVSRRAYNTNGTAFTAA